MCRRSDVDLCGNPGGSIAATVIVSAFIRCLERRPARLVRDRWFGVSIVVGRGHRTSSYVHIDRTSVRGDPTAPST